MYHDEIFETALREAREESYHELKQEINSMEAAHIPLKDHPVPDSFR